MANKVLTCCSERELTLPAAPHCCSRPLFCPTSFGVSLPLPLSHPWVSPCGLPPRSSLGILGGQQGPMGLGGTRGRKALFYGGRQW